MKNETGSNLLKKRTSNDEEMSRIKRVATTPKTITAIFLLLIFRKEYN
jgi:hypothetical protein